MFYLTTEHGFENFVGELRCCPPSGSGPAREWRNTKK